MAASPNEVYWIELVLFYALALGIVCLPLRWSLLCLLLAGNVAVNSPSFVSTSSVSWQNAIETVVLPIVLMLRLTRFRFPRIEWRFPSKVWVALIVYAAISILWSPFKLSGVKMVAYLVAWFVLYIVFHIAWRQRLLDQAQVIAALWGSISLACVQTYALGNPLFGVGDRVGEFVSAQFAPFRGPQYFGPFLACVLSLLLFSRERRRLRNLSILACLVALLLTASRYSLIEASFVLLAGCALWTGVLCAGGRVRFGRALTILGVVTLVFFGFRAVIARTMTDSRINQLLELGSQPDVAEQGDFGWRLLVYGRTLTTLSERPLLQKIFGSGTSSGGEVATEITDDSLDSVDPNRTIHDEFLRAEFEWGLVGLSLGIGMLIYSLRKLWARSFRLNFLSAYAALAIMPGIFLALLVENPLAGPSGAEGLGYLLVLTYGFCLSPRTAPNIFSGIRASNSPAMPEASRG